MLPSASLIIQAAGLLVVFSASAIAQTPPPAEKAGPGATTTHPSQIDKSQNSILPSAGRSGPSAAPTMVYDCKAKPEDCTIPATPADKAGASHTNPIKP